MTSSHFIKRPGCPACKSKKNREIYFCPFNKSPIKEYLEGFYIPQGLIEFEYLNGSSFTLIECDLCGLIYQLEIPNDFLMHKIYEEWIDPVKDYKKNRETTDYDDYLYYAQELMPIIAYFNMRPGQLKFCDFGMGWGTWSLIAKAFGCDSHGTELSDTRIKHAESNGIKVISWEELPNHSFHFINTEQVFEHIAEPFETMKYLKNCLHSEGLLKISVPDGSHIKRRLNIGDWHAPKGSKNSLNPVAPLEHINCFKKKTILKMADLAGFKQIKLPLGLQYAYTAYGKTLKQILKSVLRPLYKNYFKRTYVFLRQKAAY